MKFKLISFEEQNFPIYKVTLSNDNFDTYKVEEYFCQKIETELKRFDKDWITCGIPKGIISLL